jgi:hypothetical protein
MKFHSFALSTALLFSRLSSASASIVDNTNLASPGYYNGTGPVNGNFRMA